MPSSTTSDMLIYGDRPVAVAIVARLATYLRQGLPAAPPPGGPGLAVGTAVRRPDFKDSVLLPGSGGG